MNKRSKIMGVAAGLSLFAMGDVSAVKLTPFLPIEFGIVARQSHYPIRLYLDFLREEAHLFHGLGAAGVVVSGFYYRFCSSTYKLRCAKAQLKKLQDNEFLQKDYDVRSVQAMQDEFYSRQLLPLATTQSEFGAHLKFCQELHRTCRKILDGEKPGSAHAKEAQAIIDELKPYQDRIVFVLNWLHGQPSYAKQLKYAHK